MRNNSSQLQFRQLLRRLPERFQWTLHNVLAHPASEVLFQLGLVGLGEWVHDATVPAPAQTGRDGATRS